jgi:transporter family-2 protein
VGVIFALLLCLLAKKRLFRKLHLPLWAYLGGVIGVLTTLFNNYAYAHLSMTGIVALGLLGQCVTANLLDACGLCGMKKRRISGAAWLGIAMSCAGVLVMLSGSASGGAAAAAASLGAGVTVVMSRTVNSRLAGEAGALAGSFYNHLIGLPVCVLLAAAVPAAQTFGVQTFRPWHLCGGMLGVVVVMLFNITVPRLPAFRADAAVVFGAGVRRDSPRSGLRARRVSKAFLGRRGLRRGTAGRHAAGAAGKAE